MSLIVEPTSVRKPRRGPDPAPLVLVGLVVFVALALAKPWQPAPPSPGPTAPPTLAPAASGPVAASPSPSAPSPSIVPIPVAAAPETGPLRWPDLLGALPQEDDYGLRVVTRRLSARGSLPVGALASEPNVTASLGGTYRVIWQSASSRGTHVMLADPNPGQGILALGVTAPGGLAPLDVRFWRLMYGQPPQRLSTPDVPGDPMLGDRLFLPPLEDGPVSAWPSGNYAVDLLEGGSVKRFAFDLWSASQARRPASSEPPAEVVPFDAGRIPRATPGLPTGPFTIGLGGAVHGWAGDPGPALDNAGAWLASMATQDAAGVSGSSLSGRQVARALGPAPAVIGVILPSDAVVSEARLVSLAPDAGVVSVAPLLGHVGGGASLDQPTFVAFVPTATPTWPAGVYRIDVSYVNAIGPHLLTSWHIDISSGGGAQASAPAPAPPLLDAAAHWAGVPSGWAIVTGETTRRGGSGPASPGPITVWSAPPLSADPAAPPDPPDPPGVQVCGDAALLNAARSVIGISFPARVTHPQISVVRAFAGIGGVRVPAVISRGVQSSLWLIAPPADSGGTWPSGRYQIEVLANGIDPPSFEGGYRACFGSFSSVNPTFSLPAGPAADQQYRSARLEPGALTWRVMRLGLEPVILEP